MIGSPPGYVGHEAGGQLTEAVRRHPYSVILLDEVEKAHPEVMNVLLQLLDDGRLSDGKGRVVDFRNTLVIMTSNLCQNGEFEPPRREETEKERLERENRVIAALQGHFRPEFLNRLDGLVRFGSLSREMVATIVRLELAKMDSSLKEQNIDLQVTDEAVLRLAELGFDPAFGARPVKRVIQQEVQDPLADLILAGDVRSDTVVKVGVGEEGLVLTTAGGATGESATVG